VAVINIRVHVELNICLRDFQEPTSYNYSPKIVENEMGTGLTILCAQKVQ